MDMVAEPGREDDRLRLIAHPGGSPANVAVALARLGVSTSFAGRISGAGFGPWLRAHLDANEVDTTPSVTAIENASLALVTLDAARVPSYTFYVEGTADWQWHPSELSRVSLTGVTAVHTGSLALALEPGRATLATWLSTVRGSGQAFISFDPNVRPTLIDDLAAFRERTIELVSLAHLVKVSEEDLHSVAPRRGPDHGRNPMGPVRPRHGGGHARAGRGDGHAGGPGRTRPGRGSDHASGPGRTRGAAGGGLCPRRPRRPPTGPGRGGRRHRRRRRRLHGRVAHLAGRAGGSCGRRYPGPDPGSCGRVAGFRQSGGRPDLPARRS